MKKVVLNKYCLLDSDIDTELERNREAAKRDGREFIIDEMKYVISEYNNHFLNKSERSASDMER